MDLADLKDWATLIGASVAAIAGVWNLMIQRRGKRDRFLVRGGTFQPGHIPGNFMHVISLSDHPILLSDWGFIDDDLVIRSARVELAYDGVHFYNHFITGTSLLERRNDVYEVGYVRKDPIGTFALSVSQTRPRAYFFPNVPLWKRLIVRIKLFWPRYAYGF